MFELIYANVCKNKVFLFKKYSETTFFDLILAFYILAFTIQYTKLKYEIMIQLWFFAEFPTPLCPTRMFFIQHRPLYLISRVYKYECGGVHSSGDLYCLFKFRYKMRQDMQVGGKNKSRRIKWAG